MPQTHEYEHFVSQLHPDPVSWEPLGPEFAFMDSLKDFTPMFLMPGYESQGKSCWGDYKDIHGTDIPYHLGNNGIESLMTAARGKFNDSPTKDDFAKNDLLDDIHDGYAKPPFDKHGKMKETARRFMNAFVKKAAKGTSPARRDILMQWLRK